MNNDLIKRYADSFYFRKPSEQEKKDYSVNQELENKRLEEEYSKRGVPFLSDEWRCMMIDKEVERCKEFIKKHEQ